ncbi:MAG: class I tRNA ligase family protein [Pirellulaceae bacterium]
MHDPNDYEVALRCDLPMINILNVDGTLNAEAGKYQGLTVRKGGWRSSMTSKPWTRRRDRRS